MKRRSCVHFKQRIGCGVECKDGCPSYTRVRKHKVTRDKYQYQKDRLAYEKEMRRIKGMGFDL